MDGFVRGVPPDGELFEEAAARDEFLRTRVTFDALIQYAIIAALGHIALSISARKRKCVRRRFTMKKIYTRKQRECEYAERYRGYVLPH